MQTAITNIKNNLYVRHPLFVSMSSIHLFNFRHAQQHSHFILQATSCGSGSVPSSGLI